MSRGRVIHEIAAEREQRRRASSRQGTSLSDQFEEIASSLPDVDPEFKPAAIGIALTLRGQVPDAELAGAVRAKLQRRFGDEWKATT